MDGLYFFPHIYLVGIGDQNRSQRNGCICRVLRWIVGGGPLIGFVCSDRILGGDFHEKTVNKNLRMRFGLSTTSNEQFCIVFFLNLFLALSV